MLTFKRAALSLPVLFVEGEGGVDLIKGMPKPISLGLWQSKMAASLAHHRDPALHQDRKKAKEREGEKEREREWEYERRNSNETDCGFFKVNLSRICLINLWTASLARRSSRWAMLLKVLSTWERKKKAATKTFLHELSVFQYPYLQIKHFKVSNVHPTEAFTVNGCPCPLLLWLNTG